MEGKVILVVAGHPDDPEGGCGGTIAKFVSQGAIAYYVISTNGDRGSRGHDFEAEDLVKSRHQEQENAAKIIGAKETIFLDHEDGNLIADIKFKEELVKIIRKLKPDMVFTHDPSWFYRVNVFKMGDKEMSFINHNDHRETGIGVLDAVYPLARDRASFPEHEKEGLLSHKVNEVYLFHAGEPNFYVDITKTIDTKIAAMQAHKSQVDNPKEVAGWMTGMATEAGKKAECQYAESFTRLILM